MNFNKHKKVLFLQLLLFLNCAGVLAQQTNESKPLIAVNDIKKINLKVEKKDKPALKIHTSPKKLEGSLSLKSTEAIKNSFDLQKKNDVEDIENLWKATVERNKVIDFAVKKLSMPAEQRRIHSSIMAKSVSGLINGAALLPAVFGVDSTISSAASVGGSLASRAISKKAFPKELPVTDSELIQLAGVIEDLQNRIIKNYYDYKSSLEALQVCQKNILTENKNYSNALNSNNDMAMIVSSATYDKQLLEEEKIIQKVKLYRLELERLAGHDCVAKLNLFKIDPLSSNSSNIKKLSSQIDNELQDEKEKMLGDLNILWSGSVEKSETIKFAIYKLSNPDGDKQDSNAVKKILSPLTSAATLVGSNASSAITSGSAVLGGGLLSSMLSDDNAINSKLSRVTDADLILLTKEIDDLQQKLIKLYCNYVSAAKNLEISDKMVKNRDDYYKMSENLGYEKKVVAETFRKEAVDQQFKARQEFLSARTDLEQFTGNQALVEIEKKTANLAIKQ